MSPISTPIIDYDKLPIEIIKFIAPFLADEDIKFCCYEKLENDKTAKITTRILTNSNIVEVNCVIDKKFNTYKFGDRKFIILNKITGISVETSTNEESHTIDIRSGASFYTSKFEPNTANRFLSTLLSIIRKM